MFVTTDLTGTETALLLKTVKRILHLRSVLLRYVLIYSLEASFHFYFSDISTVKCDQNVHRTVKTGFSLTLGYSFRASDNSSFFRFPLKVRVIGKRLYDVIRCTNEHLQNYKSTGN